MKTMFSKQIQCQSRGCVENATWREIDHYTQQKQSFTYFYYFCDKHKEKAEFETAGHKKEFQKVVN